MIRKNKRCCKNCNHYMETEQPLDDAGTVIYRRLCYTLGKIYGKDIFPDEFHCKAYDYKHAVKTGGE